MCLRETWRGKKPHAVLPPCPVVRDGRRAGAAFGELKPAKDPSVAKGLEKCRARAEHVGKPERGEATLTIPIDAMPIEKEFDDFHVEFELTEWDEKADA